MGEAPAAGPGAAGSGGAGQPPAAGPVAADSGGVSASTPAGKGSPGGGAPKWRGTALGLFIEHRRSEHAANGVSVPLMVLQQEWRRLPDAEKQEFESRASERRGVTSVESTADILRRQQEQRSAVRPIDPNEAPAAKRSRAATSKAQQLPPAVPRPSFPVREALPGRPVERRRREVAETLRAQTEGRGGQITVASSHRVDLTELNRRLSAPRLSCDWQSAGQEEEDEDQVGPRLEVELPAEREARGFLRQELSRRVSSARVQSLVQAGAG
uniref:Uncharacterized protein n=1 Tax=Alexandrium monilatum TaxID=311494 RepID=A0A7S4QJD6_9DINO